jgi:cystathionine beta-synthase
VKKTTEPAMDELQFYPTIVDAIGNTPLVRLNRIAKDVPPLVLVKVETMNPGGSVKDRIGPNLIAYCERQGLLKPGGTIVEPTSGNTGHSLAIVAATRGYRCIFTMSDKVSEEKRDLLRAYGAQLVICPAKATPDSPDFYRNVARRLTEEIPGACCPDQYSNPANGDAHYQTTGPEIWRDTAGRVTVFVATIGTGGTISGTGRYLKEVNPRIKIIGADPAGSQYSGDMAEPYLVEGIGWTVGKDMFPKNYHPDIVDEFVRIDDRTSFYWAQRLAREEGILVGGSAGTALGAGLTYAKQLSPEDMVVILLPDTGRAYLSKQYNETWLRKNGLFIETENE